MIIELFCQKWNGNCWITVDRYDIDCAEGWRFAIDNAPTTGRWLIFTPEPQADPGDDYWDYMAPYNSGNYEG